MGRHMSGTLVWHTASGSRGREIIKGKRRIEEKGGLPRWDLFCLNLATVFPWPGLNRRVRNGSFRLRDLVKTHIQRRHAFSLAMVLEGWWDCGMAVWWFGVVRRREHVGKADRNRRRWDWLVWSDVWRYRIWSFLGSGSAQTGKD